MVGGGGEGLVNFLPLKKGGLIRKVGLVEDLRCSSKHTMQRQITARQNKMWISLKLNEIFFMLFYVDVNESNSLFSPFSSQLRPPPPLRPLPPTFSTRINFYFKLSGPVALKLQRKCWALNLCLNTCLLTLVTFQINLILCFQMKTMFPSFMAWVFLAQGIHNTFSGELVKVIW